MFRHLDFRSFLNFLGRNKLYTAINIIGLSLSLMFVILIVDYTIRQFTVDAIQTKADRIRTIHGEGDFNTAYYLQKYLLDRYPEIEATCAVTKESNTIIKAGDREFNSTVLFADSTFFRMFDFPLVSGDRAQALATRESVVLSESFARKVFGTADPMGQPLYIGGDQENDQQNGQGEGTGEKGAGRRTYVVAGVMSDIDRSVIPDTDIVIRGDLLPEFNSTCDEQMSNAGAVVTFLLVREGADIDAKIPDMLDYFKQIYWIYRGNVNQQVLLTPLREVYFSDPGSYPELNHGSRSFVMILFGVGAVILAFAVMNYINLTVAQTGFRAKEMATRRLLGASGGEIVMKLILESTAMCVVAFLAALLLAEAAAPYAQRLLESKIAVWADIDLPMGLCYAAFVLVLGIVSGVVPAVVIARYKPIDIVRGTLRRRTKMVYSRVLITVQNVITVVLIAASLTVALQIRHLISAPLGYETRDILDVPTDIFPNYSAIRRFRDELRTLPCVEAVALSCGTPHNRGNNNTIKRGPDAMISFQVFVGDSVFFRMLGLVQERDNHINGWALNRYALRELGIDEDATNFKLGPDFSWNFNIAGIYRDFQVGSVLDKPTSVQLWNVDDFDRWWRDGKFMGRYPWNVLIKTRGDKAEAYAAVEACFNRVVDGEVFGGATYIEQQIEADFAEQRRMLRIVGIFTLVAVLISALGLVAMSTYYVRQKEQEVAVRKVFGATRDEVLRMLTGSFMRLIAVAFVLACPVAWWGLDRWLQDYSVRISLSPLIFLVAGAFAAAVALIAVFRQSARAARANPIESIKS